MGGLSSIVKKAGSAMGLGDTGLMSSINPTALIGTAAAVGDTLYGAYAAKKEAKKEREFQKYMVDYQNAYNTPAAQMARYAEAGLNPNLIYGQQNYSASTGSVPHASIPASHIGSSVLSALKLGQDLQLGQEQIDQVKIANDIQKYNLQQAKDRGVAVGDHSMLSYLTGDVMKGFVKESAEAVAEAVEAVTSAIVNSFSKKPKTLQEKRKEHWNSLKSEKIKDTYTRRGQ